MALVTPPDLELWFTSFLRSRVGLTGIDFTNKEPVTLSMPLPRPLVVIRDDSGPMESPVTFNRSIGVSVRAGSRQNDKAANDLARVLFAILTNDAVILEHGSPIAAVEYSGCNGPYAVADSHDVALRYFTVEYTVVGHFG